MLRLTDCGSRWSNPLATPKRITYELLYPRDIPRPPRARQGLAAAVLSLFQFHQRAVLPIVYALACMHVLQRVSCTSCSGFRHERDGVSHGCLWAKLPACVERWNWTTGSQRSASLKPPISKQRRGRLQPRLQHVGSRLDAPGWWHMFAVQLEYGLIGCMGGPGLGMLQGHASQTQVACSRGAPGPSVPKKARRVGVLILA
jgi:hypothetical protein